MIIFGKPDSILLGFSNDRLYLISLFSQYTLRLSWKYNPTELLQSLFSHSNMYYNRKDSVLLLKQLKWKYRVCTSSFKINLSYIVWIIYKQKYRVCTSSFKINLSYIVWIIYKQNLSLEETQENRMRFSEGSNYPKYFPIWQKNADISNR